MTNLCECFPCLYICICCDGTLLIVKYTTTVSFAAVLRILLTKSAHLQTGHTDVNKRAVHEMLHLASHYSLFVCEHTAFLPPYLSLCQHWQPLADICPETLPHWFDVWSLQTTISKDFGGYSLYEEMQTKRKTFSPRSSD